MLIPKQILIISSAAAALFAGSNVMNSDVAPAMSSAALSSAQIVGEQTGPAGQIPAGSVASFIETSLLASAPRQESGLDEEATSSPLQAAYAIRVFDPIWNRSGARDFQNYLRLAESRGLKIDPTLSNRIDLAVNAISSRNPRERAGADLLLSRVFIQVADHLRNGPFNDAPGLTDQIEQVDPAPIHTELAYAGTGRFDYESLDPAHEEYDNLLEARALYVEYVQSGGFTPVPQIDGALELGDSDPVIETVRLRLAEEGFTANTGGGMFVMAAFSQDKENSPDDAAEEVTPASHRFDESFQTALIDFQEHNGLEPDGVLGRNTIDALNVTAEQKVARIDANLERWRWIPAEFGENHVRVNIPSFRVEGYENGRETIQMRTIVGLPSRATPIFADTIEYIVANPQWYVPESILARDKLDDIQADPGYVASHGYYVLDRNTGEPVDAYDVDWSADGVVNNYRLVQRASDNNALGPVKIMFPNEHSVYLHGTPSDDLFERGIRAFSSGCVRLERPEDMARWVSRVGNIENGVETMDTAWATGQSARVELESPIPVYILYYTVEMNEEGEVVFLRDIYDRDPALVTALSQWELTLPGDGEI